MRIGILGGIFNPVHNGHLQLASGALAQLGLDQILWVPAHLPPHRPLAPGASTEAREAMVKLAIAEEPRYQLSRVELDRPGPSYAIETLNILRSERPEVSWIFLVGSDAASGLSEWKSSAELLQKIQFVVVPRAGESLKLDAKQRASFPGGIKLSVLKVQTDRVSASEVRSACKKGKSIASWVPKSVGRYIEEHKLYS